MVGKARNQAQEIPPYVSFTTFLNALNTFAEQGVPAQIDRSVLGKFSGGVQRHIIASLRFMGFTDEDNRPTEKLRLYAKADKVGRKEILSEILHERYAEQIAILNDGTHQQLNSSFDDVKVKPSVKTKCITFFLKAAKEAGFKISSHIESGTRVRRTDVPRKRKKPTKKPKQDEPEEEASSGFQAQEGMVIVPIALGPGKVWHVQVDEVYSKDEVDKFTQLIGIVLSPSK